MSKIMSEAAAQCFEYFQKIIWKASGCSRMNNHHYATHIKQLIDALDNLYACIFRTKMDFLPFQVIRKTFSTQNGAQGSLFLFHLRHTRQFAGATCRHYSEIAQLQVIFLNRLKDNSFQDFLEKRVSTTNRHFLLLV